MKVPAKIKKRSTLYILAAIVLIGSLLRIYELSTVPAGFFCDEAATGYNAYTISQSGRDEYGIFLPVFFESFGNFRPGVPIYLTAPFVFMGGLTETAVRLASAIIGITSIILMYFLGKYLFSSKSVGYLSALMLALSPWHIHFSRIGQENIYFPFFVILGLVLFLYGMRNKKPWYLPISFSAFGLGIYTYFPAYFLIPLVITALICIYHRYLYSVKRYTIVSCVLFLMFLIPLISGISSGTTVGRFNQVSSVLKDKTQEEIISHSFKTYRDHFGKEFLFTSGDSGYETHFITRFSVENMGQLYIFQLPFLFIGLLYAFKKNKHTFSLLLVFLLLYPLGSVATPFADGGGPFATRSILGIIPLQVLSAAGIVYGYILLKRKHYQIAYVALLSVLIMIQVVFYTQEYFKKYPLYSSDFWGWQYGAQEIVSYFEENEHSYDELIMAGEFNAPHIFFSFYAPDSCEKCLLGLPDMNFDPSKKQLFAVTPLYRSQHPEYNMTIQKTIYYPNGTIAFQIGEIVQ